MRASSVYSFIDLTFMLVMGESGKNKVRLGERLDNLNTVTISDEGQRGSTLYICWNRWTLGDGGVSNMGGMMRMFPLKSRQATFITLIHGQLCTL